MAIGTPVNLKNNQTDATGVGSIVATLIAGAAASDLVIVTVHYGLGSTPTTTITDTGTNTWQKDVERNVTTGNTPHVIVFSSILTTGLSIGHTVTATFGSNVNYPAISVTQVTGIASSSWLDVTNNATATGTAVDAGNLVTTVADEILWVAATTAAIAPTGSVGSGYTEWFDSNTAGKSYYQEYKIVSSTGTYASDWTATSSVEWACASASYKMFLSTFDVMLPMGMLGTGRV